jgi:predicted ABC-type transport system involved in lysophospholipase L1 biosynthesis ATPase subunit
VYPSRLENRPSHATASGVFTARGLSKIYVVGEVEVRALHDVDLDIYEREFVVLLGPSGSGKSTLLNILGGLDSPTTGQASWRDHNLVTADEAELTRYRREHVGFVFQFFNLIPGSYDRLFFACHSPKGRLSTPTGGKPECIRSELK